ncbi:MAG: hypothetical protein EP343_16360 [Deltaproteobacteria bacterium]|nr:MAG: hypothetical protein EP343_16360 [Deltaproteobacteria bacterium]
MWTILLSIVAVALLTVWTKLRVVLTTLAVGGLVILGLVLTFLLLRVLRNQMQFVTSLLIGRMIQKAQRS